MDQISLFENSKKSDEFNHNDVDLNNHFDIFNEIYSQVNILILILIFKYSF